MAQTLLQLTPKQTSVAALGQRLKDRLLRAYDPALAISYSARENKEHQPYYLALQWLLQHGKPMYAGLRQPRALHNQACHFNSYWLRHGVCEVGGEYAYAEGFVLRHLQGNTFSCAIHAWNLRKGHVYDLTYGRVMGARYLGVVYSDEFLRFVNFMTDNKLERGVGLLIQFEAIWPYLDNYVRDAKWRPV